MEHRKQFRPSVPSKRAPEAVMRLAAMGSSFPTRLSFMRTVIRRLHSENWRIGVLESQLDENGYGHAVIAAEGPERTYCLIAYSHALDPEKRTDRVIAEEWDATFTLFDGVPRRHDIARLADEVPKQEAGRCSPSELILSRANKSVRLFAHVVDRLAAGRQPDVQFLASVGYLMRTTAVYGNGKFGTADRGKFADRPELSGPFQAELLTVYLIRHFTYLLVEHVARERLPGTFVPLHRDLKQFLGIGNATGLGMAPFMHSHPVLIHNWVDTREAALQRVRAVERATPAEIASFRKTLQRAKQNVAEWNVEDQRQMKRIGLLRQELREITTWADAPQFGGTPYPWDDLYRTVAAGFSLEARELMASLVLEPYGHLIDGLVDGMSADTDGALCPGMSVGDLGELIDTLYAWALDVDLSAPDAEKQFWYVSEEKLEPRLGLRAEEPGAERELPLHVVRDVQAVRRDLDAFDGAGITAEFLMAHPEHRHIVRRIQTVATHPYGEVRDNLVGPEMMAIDLLRFKLAFFGATKFDPKSDRWTRIAMYQGAPLADELGSDDADDWAFAVMPDMSIGRDL